MSIALDPQQVHVNELLAEDADPELDLPLVTYTAKMPQRVANRLFWLLFGGALSLAALIVLAELLRRLGWS